jgi:hypothetical protein
VPDDVVGVVQMDITVIKTQRQPSQPADPKHW